MLVQSFINTIEVAAAAPGKRYSGNIKDFNELMSYGNLKQLEDSFEGVFAFIAFHPVADKFVADYVRLGSIAGDAGQHILALFTFDNSAYKPVPLEPNAFQNWISIDRG